MNPFTASPLRVTPKGNNVFIDVAPCLHCHHPLGPKPLRLNVAQANDLARQLAAAVRKANEKP